MVHTRIRRLAPSCATRIVYDLQLVFFCPPSTPCAVWPPADSYFFTCYLLSLSMLLTLFLHVKGSVGVAIDVKKILTGYSWWHKQNTHIFVCALWAIRTHANQKFISVMHKKKKPKTFSNMNVAQFPFTERYCEHAKAIVTSWFECPTNTFCDITLMLSILLSN